MTSMLAWAVGLPAAEVLIDRVPALTLTAARLTLAALALILAWAVIEGPRALVRITWIPGLLVGFGGVGLAATSLVLGQGLTDPVTAAVISATMPVWGMALEVIFDGRRVTPGLLLGVGLSIAGGLTALIGSSAQEAQNLPLGALMILISVLAFLIGSRMTVTAMPENGALARTAVTVAGGAVGATMAAVIALPFGIVPPPISAFDWGDLGALTLFAVFGMSICQLFWIASVPHLGVGLASFHMNAATFYVMAMMAALGAPWIWAQAAGAALVALGVLAAQSSPTPVLQHEPNTRWGQGAAAPCPARRP